MADYWDQTEAVTFDIRATKRRRVTLERELISWLKRKKTKIPRRLRKKFQERKRVRKTIEESRCRLMERTRKDPLSSGMPVVDAPPEEGKISEMILEYAKPLTDVAANQTEEKNALHIALTLWNIALMPADMQTEHKAKMERITEPTDENEAGSSREVIDTMIRRKKVLFPDIDRMIVDYEIVDTPTGFYLSVVSNEDRKSVV